VRERASDTQSKDPCIAGTVSRSFKAFSLHPGFLRNCTMREFLDTPPEIQARMRSFDFAAASLREPATPLRMTFLITLQDESQRLFIGTQCWG
jgi:hypothetical protein